MFVATIAKTTKKTKEKVYAVLTKVKKLLGNVGKFTKKVLNIIVELFKGIKGVSLAFVVIVLLLCLGFVFCAA